MLFIRLIVAETSSDKVSRLQPSACADERTAGGQGREVDAPARARTGSARVATAMVASDANVSSAGVPGSIGSLSSFRQRCACRLARREGGGGGARQTSRRTLQEDENHSVHLLAAAHRRAGASCMATCDVMIVMTSLYFFSPSSAKSTK